MRLLSLPPTRHLSTSASTTSITHLPIPTLPSPSLPVFRASAFTPSQPALLRGAFSSLPAINKWTTRPTISSPPQFSQSYLSAYSSTILPHEHTRASNHPTQGSNSSGSESGSGSGSFTCADAPLGVFLAWADLASSTSSPSPSPSSSSTPSSTPHSPFTTSSSSPSPSSPSPSSSPTPSTPSTITDRLTIAQAPLSSLPPSLQQDVPTPELVLHAGKGDVYADSIWLGLAPTVTPLHRDPNPNLLVQVAGRKRVRMVRPEVGGRVWEGVRRGLRERGAGAGAGAKGGGEGRGKVRGEEMMVGGEREGLEGWVWGEGGKGLELGLGNVEMWEGEIGEGDGVFIPVGWWHAVRGVGEGAVASVNWWFR